MPESLSFLHLKPIINPQVCYKKLGKENFK